MQTNDDFIRHRMSDMSVSHSNKILSPLEPNTQQPFYSKSYSRRGSVTDPAFNNSFRRPSITDMNNLPLPNSTAASRRGSIATEYDYPSRSPSPSPYTFPSKRPFHDDHPFAFNTSRRDSLPMNQLPPSIPPTSNSPVYDPYQRRHSIAASSISDMNNHMRYNNNNNSNSNNSSIPNKYRGKKIRDKLLFCMFTYAKHCVYYKQ